MSSKRTLECPYCDSVRPYRSFQEFESHMRSCSGGPLRRTNFFRQGMLFPAVQTDAL